MVPLRPSDLVILATGLAAGATAGAVLSTAALRPESQLFGRTLIAGGNPREVALTYDDGPNDASTLDLLELLAQHNVTAAFFMIGSFVRQRPDLARAVHAAGHIVGNHSDTHPWLAWQSAGRIREELRRCNQTLEDVLGDEVRYFRPPYGARRPYVLRTAAELGLTTVQWNAMGKDWEPIGADAIVANIERDLRRTQRLKRGGNILLHDGGHLAMGTDRKDTIRATALLLEHFKRSEQTVVSLATWA